MGCRTYAQPKRLRQRHLSSANIARRASTAKCRCSPEGFPVRGKRQCVGRSYRPLQNLTGMRVSWQHAGGEEAACMRRKSKSPFDGRSSSVYLILTMRSHGCPGKNDRSYSKRLIPWPIDLDRVGNNLKLKSEVGAWRSCPGGATMRNERWPDRVFSADRAFAP